MTLGTLILHVNLLVIGSGDDDPFILFRLSGAGSWWQQAKQSIQHVPLPSNIFQLLRGDPEAFPGQMRYVIPPACSGSASGSLTS